MKLFAVNVQSKYFAPLHPKPYKMHLTVQQATEKYKVSIRTLRTLIAGLTTEQKQMHLIIKGKHHLISTELLNQHYKPRTGAKVQTEAKKVQMHTTTATDAPHPDTDTDANKVQTELTKG